MTEKLDIIALETPAETEKYYAPKTNGEQPFLVTEYGKTLRGTPCYQLRIKSHLSCVQYVISGSGVIICDNNIYTVKAGDTFLLKEGCNQIYYSNPDNHFERIWINFKGRLGLELLNIYVLDDCVVFRDVNTFEIMNEIISACKNATSVADYTNKSARLFLELVQFLSEHKAATKNNINSPIEKVRLFIDNHIMENVKLSDVAKQFYFTKEHIIRTFKQTYSITPHQYIMQSKIRIAMIMLQTTDKSIEEISKLLNFSDPHHFSVQFLKFTGLRPSAYKKARKQPKTGE